MPVFIKGAGGGYATEQITNLSAQVGFSTDGKVILTWTNPSDENFKGLVIRRKTGSYPTSPTDGISVYDSNDSTPASTVTATGLIDGTQYFFRAFAYCYEGATRVYNDTLEGASVVATPLQTQGMVTFTASGTFVVPAGVDEVEVFLVGGGGGGASGYYVSSSARYTGGGGGGGYTTTENVLVTPGEEVSVIVGSGGAGTSLNDTSGSNGGNTSFGSVVSQGGQGGQNFSGGLDGGAGGSGGAGGGVNIGTTSWYGGNDGTNGGKPTTSSTKGDGGIGQGTTTRAFAEVGGTLYSGGGGGGSDSYAYHGFGGAGGGGEGNFNSNQVAQSGVPNTGGGGGGGWGYTSSSSIYKTSGNGGSGIAIIRWGY